MPNEQGVWTFNITLKDGDGERTLASGAVTAVDAGRKGLIRVDPDNPRFVYENGEPFFGLGTNLCWPDGSATLSFESYYKEFAEANGGNVVRLWLELGGDGGMETMYTGPGIFDAKYASEVDYTMLLSRQKGIKLITSIKTFHMLALNRYWEQGVFANTNGGLLDLPRDVFTSPEAKQAYKDLLRYLVARYGGYDNVLTWQFWNEENGITGYNTRKGDAFIVKKAAIAWYDEMSAYIAKIDPYQHIVSTSFNDQPGEAAMFSGPNTAFTSAHTYGIFNLAEVIRTNAIVKEQSYPGLPTFFEEQGLLQENNVFDKTGINLHTSLWASIAAGNAITAMPWWWDTYLKNNKLWNQYGPIAGFMKDLRWPDDNLKLVELDARSSLTGDYIVSGEYDNYSQAGLDPYKTFDLDFVNKKLLKPGEMIYQGYWRSKNAYTFNVNIAHDSAVIVSTRRGGNPMSSTISVQIDEEEPTTQEVKMEVDIVNITKFPLPAGSHKVTVTNSGGGDLMIGGVSFEDAVPLVEAVGAMGESAGVFWVRDIKYNWVSAMLGYAPPQITDAEISLSGIAAGDYRLVWWDTYKGKAISSQDVTVTAGDAPVVKAPAFSKDVAFKLIRKQ
ncbi:hypothetical protein FACS189492_2380 [Clostridia bacterium]|nr:hypothetical protein FACS189492_2380 [Clostridia bacterium]